MTQFSGLLKNVHTVLAHAHLQCIAIRDNLGYDIEYAKYLFQLDQREGTPVMRVPLVTVAQTFLHNKKNNFKFQLNIFVCYVSFRYKIQYRREASTSSY